MTGDYQNPDTDALARIRERSRRQHALDWIARIKQQLSDTAARNPVHDDKESQ